MHYALPDYIYLNRVRMNNPSGNFPVSYIIQGKPPIKAVMGLNFRKLLHLARKASDKTGDSLTGWSGFTLM